MATRYAEYFPKFIARGIRAELLDEAGHLRHGPPGAALDASRDFQFNYHLGLQTLYDRYFLHIDEVRIEMPQAFFKCVAMGRR